MSLRESLGKLEDALWQNERVRFKALSTEADLIYAAYDCRLTDEQKELLEKYEGSADEISGFCERDSFIYGFRLGMRLAIEALSDEHENLEL